MVSAHADHVWPALDGDVVAGGKVWKNLHENSADFE